VTEDLDVVEVGAFLSVRVAISASVLLILVLVLLMSSLFFVCFSSAALKVFACAVGSGGATIAINFVTSSSLLVCSMVRVASSAVRVASSAVRVASSEVGAEVVGEVVGGGVRVRGLDEAILVVVFGEGAGAVTGAVTGAVVVPMVASLVVVASLAALSLAVVTVTGAGIGAVTGAVVVPMVVTEAASD